MLKLVLFPIQQFATVEVIITSLKDGFGEWIDKHLKHHELLVLIVCIISFLVGIPFIFQVKLFNKLNLTETVH